MKVIYPEKILSVVADEEDTNYPANNVLDRHPTKVWRATSKDAQIKLTCEAGANAVAVFGTNADTITFTVKDETETTTLVAAESYDLKGTDTYFKLITDTSANWKQIWHDFEYQYNPIVVVIDLEAAAGVTVEAGVIRCGLAQNFNGPSLGIDEGLKRYSIIRELQNGATYMKKRNTARQFTGKLVLRRDRDFYYFMKDVIEEIDPYPLAWRITDLSNKDWAVYARADKLPVGGHDYPSNSIVKFSLLEVL